MSLLSIWYCFINLLLFSFSILRCMCFFISYLYYCIYYHFCYNLSHEISWAKNVEQRPTVSFLFSSRHIWKHVLIFFYFNIYSILVLICYLYFIIYRRAHNVVGTLGQVSVLTKFVPGVLELCKKLGLSCSKNIIFSTIVCWGVFNFQGVFCS